MPKTLMIFLALLLASAVYAQESLVPDLTGLNVPAAAAALNRAGLRLGTETGEGWSAESGLLQNTIRAQSAAPGSSLPPGSAVDVIVLRSPNAALIYDDNDLSLLNRTGAELDLTGITFANAANTAVFSASRWAPSLRDTQCVQVWSVGRNGPKGLEDCSTIQNWLVTTNAGEHFWTGAGGQTSFNVYQNGVLRATCAVASPGRCDFFLTNNSAGGDTTPYVYYAYTPEVFAVINRSTDKWMVLRGLNLVNNNPALSNPGALLPIGDPALYKRIENPVATVEQLAPGQCIIYTGDPQSAGTPPEPCDVIARFDMDPRLLFWNAAFETESATRRARLTCAAATPGRLTLCVMPR